MSRKTLGLDDTTADYVRSVGVRDDEVLARLGEETAKATGEHADMQISPEQGAFMTFLARAMGVRRALEVGTFTGYSSLCVARALPPGGKLVCIDQSDEWTRIARRYWREAGLDDRVELRLGDGLDHLDRMIASGESGNFDWCFHDADKSRLGEYVDRFLRLLRPGGVFLIDNALRGGDVARPGTLAKDPGTAGMDASNRRLREDGRIDWCLLPIGDGLAMGRKRG